MKIAAMLFLFAQTTQTVTAPDAIFARNKDAIVRIYVNGQISGCGFIISADGLIVTANHVVTTEESGFTELASKIEVERTGERRSHVVTVLGHASTNDTALLRMIGSELPYVGIGDSNKIQPSKTVTAITFLPGSSVPLLLIGTISGTATVSTGTIKADAIIFQMPVRRGFSGSPIFDEGGQVIGIVSTRLIGIVPDLEQTRRKLKELTATGGEVLMGSSNVPKTLTDLIDSLDADLVSGLGSAVDISYAKQMLTEAQNKKN